MLRLNTFVMTKTEDDANVAYSFSITDTTAVPATVNNVTSSSTPVTGIATAVKSDVCDLEFTELTAYCT